MPPALERTAKQVRQFICGLHGHDALYHFDKRHVSLVCVLCGHQSPGWNLPGSAASTGTPSARAATVTNPSGYGPSL
jgi:hypothetical protein